MTPTAPASPYNRADAETWARAQADYAAGVPVRLIAERHRLGERNLRRRAFREDWPRRTPDLAELDPQARGLVQEDIAFWADDRREQEGDLLARPRPAALLNYAFRRATEAAVRSSPLEASYWLRLVEQLRRSGDTLTQAAADHDYSDGLRAGYMDRHGLTRFDEEVDADGEWLDDAQLSAIARAEPESESSESAETSGVRADSDSWELTEDVAFAVPPAADACTPAPTP